MLSLLSAGLNERFSGSNAGTAFGEGVYLAEDVGKTDQYVTTDASYDPKSALHSRLYGRSHRHPGSVHYVLVCRVALGYPCRTKAGGRDALSMDTKEKLFPRGFRELAPVPGVLPPIYYHSLIAELGATICAIENLSASTESISTPSTSSPISGGLAARYCAMTATAAWSRPKPSLDSQSCVVICF